MNIFYNQVTDVWGSAAVRKIMSRTEESNKIVGFVGRPLFVEHFKELVIKKKSSLILAPLWIGGAPSICLFRLCHRPALVPVLPLAAEMYLPWNKHNNSESWPVYTWYSINHHIAYFSSFFFDVDWYMSFGLVLLWHKTQQNLDFRSCGLSEVRVSIAMLLLAPTGC